MIVHRFAALLAALLLAPAAHAQWVPTKPVEFIVAAGPGGALDQVARVTKQFFEEQKVLGDKPLIVVNRPGGAGKVAFDVLASRPGDPHVLSLNTHGYLASFIGGSLDVLPHRDFTSIAVLLDETVAVAVRADSALASGRDLVAALKGDPGSQRIAVATSVGNHIHVGVAKPLQAAGIDISRLTVVPFKSSADSIVALLGGHLEVVASTTPNIISQYQAGRIRLLALSSGERLGGALADVPTWKEQGVDSEFRSSLGIVAPKGLTREQIDFWESAFKRLTASEEWKKALARTQSQPHFLGAADAQKFYEAEYASMRPMIESMKLGK
jgi:putative tricarboxylic transport membrane protein